MKTIIILLLLALPIHAWGATVYIDVGATGANNGTSPTDAYESYATPSYACGNTYLIKKGTTEYVTSGTGKTINIGSCSGNEMEIGAYGTGALPIITTVPLSHTGFDDADCWVSQGSDVWRWTPGSCTGEAAMDITTDGLYNRVWGNSGAGLVELVVADDAGSIDTTYRWYPYSTSSIDVYSPDPTNPAAYYSAMRVSVEERNVFYLLNSSYFLIHDLDLQAVGWRGGAAILANTIANSKFYDNNFTQLWLEDEANANEVYGNTFDPCIITDCAVVAHTPHYEADALAMQDSDSNLVYDNVFSDARHTAVSIKSNRGACNGENGSDDNKVYDNYIGWTNPGNTYGRAFDVWGETTGCEATGNEIYRNYIKDQEALSQVSSGPNTIYNNIWDTTNSTTYGAAQAGNSINGAITLYTARSLASNGNKLYNNTFYNIADAAIHVNKGGVDNEVINNIIYNSGVAARFSSGYTYGGTGDNIAISLGAYDSTNDDAYRYPTETVIENNIVYQSNAETNVIATYLEDQARTFATMGNQCLADGKPFACCTSAVNGCDAVGAYGNTDAADPLFTEVGRASFTDVSLTAQSPAIDSGQYLSGYDTCLRADSYVADTWITVVTGQGNFSADGLGDIGHIDFFVPVKDVEESGRKEGIPYGGFLHKAI